MRHHPLLFSLGGWPPAREVDPSPTRRLQGLPPRVVTIRPNNQCFGRLHPTTLLWRILARFSDNQQQQGITLLQYVDDTMFLLKGTTNAAKNVSTILDIFSDYSSLYLNCDKFMLVTVGMLEEEATRCSAILATPLKSLPIRYLGMPPSANLDTRLAIDD